MDATKAQTVLEGLAVDGWPGVYVLGCIDRRVTVYSQQVRALNLAVALVASARVKVGERVVVVGAGAAGLTCAAGLRTLGAKVTVLEARAEILPLFRGGSTRWLHPGVYDWPLDGWDRDRAGLPLLDWAHGSVDDVRAQLEAGWAKVADGVTVRCGVREVRLEAKGDASRSVVWNPGGRERAATVILAVGFGLEATPLSTERRYWEGDDFDAPRVDGVARKWLVSGCGDGALTDLFRLCLRAFRHDRMLEEFTSDRRTAGIRAEIRRIEEDAAIQDDPVKLHDAYAGLEAPWVVDAMQERGRTDTKVTLAAPTADFLTRGASPLNRFLAGQLYAAGSFELVPSKVASAEPEGAEVVVRFADETGGRFDRIVRRHGPLASVAESFPLIAKAIEADRAQRRSKPTLTDQTRERFWNDAVFGPEVRDGAGEGQPPSMPAAASVGRDEAAQPGGPSDGRMVWDASGSGAEAHSTAIGPGVDNRGGGVGQQINVFGGSVILGGTTISPPGVGEPRPDTECDPVPPADPVTVQLEALYAVLAECKIKGEDTAAIEAEILELRRRKRQGPTLHRDEHLGQGRFRLLEVIGQGGFAVVWKAYDNKERRLVAVKVLHGELARVESRRERLFRGAKRMAELQHPNVVRVLVPEGDEDGFYYFVMELITGGDLHRAVTKGKLDGERALAAIDGIADALTAAHASGLVHRDVKPENILLREDGAPVLSDFDLVQARDTTGGTRTTAMGSVLYAAPEQNEDASRVDHRADVYSLGMTAVFCVHGKKLPHAAMFHRDTFLGGLECKEAIREVLQRAVALDVEHRFESMTSFRQALAAARQSEEAKPVRVEVAEPRPEPPMLDAGIVGTPGLGGRASTRVAVETKVVAGVELVLVLVPGGWFSMGSAKDDDSAWNDEWPQHEVELASFYLARTPVTNAQYREYLNANPNVAEPKYWGDQRFNQDEQPVVGVSWNDARAYCKWAGLVLPTEAQWEYACRAGTTTRYWSGDSEEDLARVGWYDGNSDNRLHPVGEKDPNPFGLYDMHGNVREWCEDTWVGSYKDVEHQPVDGLRVKPVGFGSRVFRGGVFDNEARLARSAYRSRRVPVYRVDDLGFRPAQGDPFRS